MPRVGRRPPATAGAIRLSQRTNGCHTRLHPPTMRSGHGPTVRLHTSDADAIAAQAALLFGPRLRFQGSVRGPFFPFWSADIGTIVIALPASNMCGSSQRPIITGDRGYVQVGAPIFKRFGPEELRRAATSGRFQSQVEHQLASERPTPSVRGSADRRFSRRQRQRAGGQTRRR